MNIYLLIARRFLFPRNGFRSNTINFISFVGLFIGAASIVAKVSRDSIMVSLDKQYPGYGFAQHKGYPTQAHIRAIEKLGVIPDHRLAFSPVRKLSQNDNRENT